MLLRSEGFFRPTTGAPTAVTEVSSTAFDDTAATSPKDAAITVPAGSNRIMLDLIGFIMGYTGSGTGEASAVHALDPASANQILTQLSGSPLDSDVNNEGVVAAFLLNGGLATVGTGAKTLRYTQTTGRRCCRQVIFLSGAEQTTPASANNITITGALTVTLTGTFPQGTYLLGVAYCDNTTNHTVTGSVVEVAERTQATDTTTFVLANATVGVGGITNPTFTVTRDLGGNTRKAGFLIAVKPA